MFYYILILIASMKTVEFIPFLFFQLILKYKMGTILITKHNFYIFYRMYKHNICVYKKVLAIHSSEK